MVKIAERQAFRIKPIITDMEVDQLMDWAPAK
jgi:hypothetical protein